MKDLPHHIKKLNRRVIRSAHREEVEEAEYDIMTPRKQTERQIKKQAKERTRQERLSRTPSPLTPEERNRKMKHRVPIFDRLSAKPKTAKPTKKKTPRI